MPRVPPSTCELLADHGHEAITPTDLGAHNLPDNPRIEIAGTEGPGAGDLAPP